MAKDATYMRLINTSRWLRLRVAALTAHPLCERCRQEGRVKAATEVHHIRPVEDGLTYEDKESLMYDRSNLMCLCHRCHVQTHKELGRTSRDSSQRRTQMKLESIRRKFF